MRCIQSSHHLCGNPCDLYLHMPPSRLSGSGLLRAVLFVIAAVLSCGLVVSSASALSSAAPLAEPYVITQVGLCNAENVAPGFCHDAQPVLVFVGNERQRPTELPGIFVSLPNDTSPYACTQVALHLLGYPFGWSCVLPSFSPRYVGSFKLTINSSAGLSAPYSQLSFVPDLRIQSVTGCSTAERGRTLPGFIDGEWLNITGQGFVQPLQVNFGVMSLRESGVSCRQTTVLSQQLASCKVTMPSPEPEYVARSLNVSASQWLLGYDVPASAQDVAVDGMYVHVVATVDTIAGCVNGSYSGCMKGDVLTVTGSHFAYAPSLTTMQLQAMGWRPWPFYQVTNFTILNDTTLLFTVPQTGGEQQLNVFVTIDGALSAYVGQWINMAPVPFIRGLSGCTNGSTAIDCHPGQVLTINALNFAGRNGPPVSIAIMGGTSQYYGCQGPTTSPKLWVLECVLPSAIDVADRHRPLQVQVTDLSTGWVSNSVTITITDDLRIDAISGCATRTAGNGTADCMPGATITLIGAGFTSPASLGLYAAADNSSTRSNVSYVANLTATVVSSGVLTAVLPGDAPLARWLDVQLSCGVLSPALSNAVRIASPLSSTGGSTGQAHGDGLPLGLTSSELSALVLGLVLALGLVALLLWRYRKNAGSSPGRGSYEGMPEDRIVRPAERVQRSQQRTQCRQPRSVRSSSRRADRETPLID